MERISYPTSAPGGQFTDGDPATSVPATDINSSYLNAVQAEIVNAIADSGLTPDGADLTQLAKAIRRLGSSSGGLRNQVINGDFRIWQRTSAFTGIGTTETYTADRFAVLGDGSGGLGVASVARQAFPEGQADVPGARFFLRYQQTTPSTAGGGRIATKLEVLREMSNGDISVSLYLKSSVSVTVQASVVQVYGSSEQVAGGAALAVTNVWQPFTFTLSAPSLQGQLLSSTAHLRLELSLPQGAPLVDVARVQLEKGLAASAFENRPMALEKLLCERYFEKSYDEGSLPGRVTTVGSASGEGTGTSAHSIASQFRVEKRTNPSVTFYSPTTGAAGTIDWPTAQAVTGLSPQPGRGSTGVPLIGAFNSSPTKIRAHWTADAEL